MKVALRVRLNLRAVNLAYQQGESASSLARKYGCDPDYMLSLLKKLGVKTRPRARIKNQADAIKAWYADGLSVGEIASRLGCDNGSVRRVLVDSGEPFQKHRKPRTCLHEHKNVIIERYASGESCRNIGLSLGFQELRIRDALVKWGVPRRVKERYPVNDSFFTTIDTEEKAYCLGFWMADGWTRSDSPMTGIGLTDRDILETMLAAMGYGGPVRVREPSGRRKKRHYFAHISSQQMREDLVRHGCVPTKTYDAVLPPCSVVPAELYHHLLRGWLDGDGCISRSKEKWVVTMAGTKAVCEGVAHICEVVFGFRPVLHVNSVNPKTGHETWAFRIGAKDDISAFLGWLYRGATIYLGRKKQKYVEFQGWLKDKKRRRRGI